jgi:hypothetical protein
MVQAVHYPKYNPKGLKPNAEKWLGTLTHYSVGKRATNDSMEE